MSGTNHIGFIKVSQAEAVDIVLGLSICLLKLLLSLVSFFFRRALIFSLRNAALQLPQERKRFHFFFGPPLSRANGEKKSFQFKLMQDRKGDKHQEQGKSARHSYTNFSAYLIAVPSSENDVERMTHLVTHSLSSRLCRPHVCGTQSVAAELTIDT